MSRTSGSASIARSSAVMAAGTLASRLLGFIRNALLISALGATASGAADAFNTANALSTQLYNLLIGGILNAILVPQIVRALRQKNGDELVNRLLTAASMLLLVVAGLLTAASPLVIMFYASGLGRWQPLAFAFAFWCMPQVFFYGLYALWGQVLNARSNFGPYMWSPVLNNIVSIVSLVAYLHLYGGYVSGQDPSIWTFDRVALIGALTTLGIVVQALVLYFPLVHSGFRPRFVWGVRGMGLGEMSKVALWALLGVLLMSVGDWATTNLGSQAVSAAESARYADVIVPSTTMYANTQLIYMLPQSLVTTSVITALFTRMSEKAAAGDAEGVRDDLSLGLRSVGVFTVLSGFGIAVLGTPALQAFVPSLSLAEAQAGAPMMTVLGLGVVVQGMWFTVQRVMLAYSDTKNLLWASIAVGLTITAFCAGGFLLAPANQWMTWACAGIVFSHAAGTLSVLPFLRRYLPDLDGRRITSTYTRLILSVLPASAAGIGLRRLMGPADGSMTGTRAVDAVIVVVACALTMTLVYLVVARLLRVEELSVLFTPASRVVAKLGRVLPGAAGRSVTRLAQALDPAPAEPGPAPAPPSQALTDKPVGAVPAPAASTARRIAGGPESHGSPGARDPRSTVASGGGRPMTEARPIGTGRYELIAPLSSALPRVVRHQGRDTILDRDVTVLTLTDATPNLKDVLEAASRAVLVEDPRLQRVYDVEQGSPAFIVMEPASGRTLSSLVEEGMEPSQVRAVVGEVAEALDVASRRGLNHRHLSPESVRVRPDGTVQVAGVGIEAAVLGAGEDDEDPLAADRADAHALSCLLYYGLTQRWPGKRSGIPSAPTREGVPVAPSSIVSSLGQADADLDTLVTKAWSQEPPISASQVASALRPWNVQDLPGTGQLQEPVGAASTGFLAGIAGSAQGVISRLRGRSGEPALPTPVSTGQQDVPAPGSAPVTVSPAATAPEAATQPATEVAAAPLPPREAPVSPRQSSPQPHAQEASLYEDEDAAYEEDEDVSRSVSRTTFAVMLAMLVAVLVGVFFAVTNLLQLAGVHVADEDLPAARTVPTASAPAAQAPAAESAQQSVPIEIGGAQSLDPFGDSNEHPELASTLTDGDPSTQWYSRYYAAPSLSWKQGLGAAVTLRQEASVSGITMQGTGTGGHVQVRATSPEDPTGGTVLAEGPFTSGTTTFDFSPTTASAIVVWVTELPTASDGLNKVTISEITLR